MNIVKAITLYQPYASLIIAGQKRFETRTWGAQYSGLLVIHAGKTLDVETGNRTFMYHLLASGIGDYRNLPLGAHFGVVSSPNYDVHPQSPLRPWHYVTFEVCLYQARRGRMAERSYKQVAGTRRHLSRFEVPHFEAMWLDILMMGRKAG